MSSPTKNTSPDHQEEGFPQPEKENNPFNHDDDNKGDMGAQQPGGNDNKKDSAPYDEEDISISNGGDDDDNDSNRSGSRHEEDTENRDSQQQPQPSENSGDEKKARAAFNKGRLGGGVMLRGESHMDKIYLFNDGKHFLHAFIVLSIIAFALALTATTTVPWFKGRLGRKWCVWKEWGAGQPTVWIGDIHTCSGKQQYWQTIAAMSVISTVSNALAIALGIMCRLGVGHLGVAIIVSMWAFTSSLTAWALALSYYHSQHCDEKPLASGIARLHAGFALMVVSSVLSFACFMLLTIFLIMSYRPSKTYRIRHWMRVVYMLLLIICTIFIFVGTARNMWSKDFPTRSVRVGLWHTEVYDRELRESKLFGRHHYKCSAYNIHMGAGTVAALLSAIFVFATLLFATMAVYRKYMYLLSNIFGVICFVLLTITVGVILGVRFRTFCTVVVPPEENLWVSGGYNGVPTGVANAIIQFYGYHISEGLALIITTWVLMFVGVIANFLIGRDNGGRFDNVHDPFSTTTEESYHYSVVDPMEMRGHANPGDDPFNGDDAQHNPHDPFQPEKPKPEGGWAENEPFYSETRPNRAIQKDFAPVGPDEDVDAAYNMMVGGNGNGNGSGNGSGWK